MIYYRYPIAAGAQAPDNLPGERLVMVRKDGADYICSWETTDPAVLAAYEADALVEHLTQAEFDAAAASGNYEAR